FLASRFFFLFHSPPRRGAGGAPAGARMPRCASGGVHDRTRALTTFEAGARHFQRPKCPPLGAPPGRFFDVTALYFRCSLDQAAMAALGVTLQGRRPRPPTVRSQSAPGTPRLARPFRFASREDSPR